MNLDQTIFTQNFKRIITVLGVMIGSIIGSSLWILFYAPNTTVDDIITIDIFSYIVFGILPSIIIIFFILFYIRFVKNNPFKKLFITFICMALFSGVLAAPHHDIPKWISNRTVFLAYLGSNLDQHHLAVMYHLEAIGNDDKEILKKKIYWKARAEQK